MKHRCKEVTHLVLKSQDQPLRWTERLHVRTHLWYCTACSRFAAQMRFMQQTMSAWRDRR